MSVKNQPVPHPVAADVESDQRAPNILSSLGFSLCLKQPLPHQLRVVATLIGAERATITVRKTRDA